MGYFDALTISSFKTTEDGQRLFFPWGAIGRGYLIPNENEYQKLKRAIKTYLLISMPLVIFVFPRLPIRFSLIIAFALILPYIIWAKLKCRNMQEAKKKLTLEENTSTMALAFDWPILLFLGLGSLAFVLASLYILFKKPEYWIIAVVSVIFSSIAAVFFAKMIAVKKKK